MNLDSSEYTVIDDMIIIHWKVDKPIGTIDEKFKKLIFSDYNNFNICTKQNNNNTCWRGSQFNHSISLTNSLTHLTFGFIFNQPVSLTNSLTHLTFGELFNQPVSLTDNLIHLTFGNMFDQHIILTNSLTYLTFEYWFNQPISLIDSLTHLTLGCTFKQSIELSNIKYLNIDCNNLHLIEN
jgi:hypothetical protein